MTTKTCFKCEKDLPLSAFFALPQMTDGHLGMLVKCTQKDVRENYAARREQYSAYERKRNLRPARRAKKRAAEASHKERYPLRAPARNAVSNALRSGKLSRDPCEACGVPKVQAHHDDYAKPLDVRWLCFQHHRELHGQVVTRKVW